MRLALVWLGWWMAASMPALSSEVVLRPGMEAVDGSGVPPLHIEIAEHELSDVSLFLEPESGAYDWISDEAFLLNVRVGEEGHDSAVLTVWNWNNEPVWQSLLSPGTTESVSVRVQGFGSYLLTLDAISGGEAERRLIRNLAVIPDLRASRASWKADEFFLGICTFPGRYHWTPGGEATLPAGMTEASARNLEAELMARAGFQVVRVDESLEMGRRENGDYLFDSTRMDAAVAAYTTRGFALGLQLMNAADWAVEKRYENVKEHRWRYPHREDPQRAYIRALLERYGKTARFVQIFNEPDQEEFWSGTSAEFVKQFQFSHEEIREVLPEIPVANGGYAYVDEKKTAFFIEALHPLVDLPAYHAHGELVGMIEHFDLLRQQYREVGIESAPWVNTETGFDAWRLDQERRQAQAVAQKVLYCWAHDHAGVMLFCGRMTRGPGRDGRDLGLVDYQFCPRFAYGAVCGLVRVMAGASPFRVHQTEEGIHAFEFERGQDRLVAAFSLRDSGRLTVRSNASQVRRIDPMGNVRESTAGGDAILELDGYPRYLLLEGADEVEVN